jgi:S-adenosylmethionine synthetase
LRTSRRYWTYRKKIIVDTYGGKSPRWWKCFFWKDPSKVDRSAAYATRHIAKNLVAAGAADEILVSILRLVQLLNQWVFFIDTHGTQKVNLTNGEC